MEIDEVLPVDGIATGVFRSVMLRGAPGPDTGGNQHVRTLRLGPDAVSQRHGTMQQSVGAWRVQLERCEAIPARLVAGGDEHFRAGVQVGPVGGHDGLRIGL